MLQGNGKKEGCSSEISQETRNKIDLHIWENTYSTNDEYCTSSGMIQLGEALVSFVSVF